MKDYSDMAAALYDGGWRAEDIEELAKEHDLTEDEAAGVCKLLEYYEQKSKERRDE